LDGEKAILILNISNYKTAVIERGTYYFSLSNYPHITELELSKIVAFIKYEKSHGRQTEIVCEDESILSIINHALAHLGTTKAALPFAENNFVYHATDTEATREILSNGKLLSAAKVYGKTGKELAFEKRDSPWNDPADYFEYIMFCWGNSMIGDYVVLSESFPSEADLVKGNFNPGVRFYFWYEDMIRHPECVFDGYHPVKVKDEIVLSDYLYVCIVPEQYKSELENYSSPELASKIHYLPQKSLGISDWNEKVYCFVSTL